MTAEKPALCDGCPGKGDARVDLDIHGHCVRFTLDSFRQARRYRAFCPDDYASNEELVELSSSGLMYYEPDIDDYESDSGDPAAAWLGVLCAERFLAGECDKTLQEFTLESEID